VFDTIAAEAQRQLNETFTAFVRKRLPRYGRPDVDMIEGPDVTAGDTDQPSFPKKSRTSPTSRSGASMARK
jgi:excinuclease UvrABC ATPase subunit